MKEVRDIITLVTDVHLDNRDLEERKESFIHALEVAEELETPIFLLGDMFNTRTGQSLEVLDTFSACLDSALEKGVKIYAIAGNHDKTNLEDEKSFLSIFKHHPAIKVFEKQDILFFDEIICCFLPYFPENGTYPDRLKDIAKKVGLNKENKKVFLFTHIAVDQVRNNDGSLVKNDLTPDKFKIFDLVFIGHYHNRSLTGDKFFYIGSSRPKDFGEDNEKGCISIDNNGDFRMIPGKFKKFIKKEFDIPKDTKKLEKLMKMYSNKNDNIRFVLKGTEEHLSIYKKADFSKIGIDLKKTTVKFLDAINRAKEGESVEFDPKTVVGNFVNFCKENSVNMKIRKKALKILNDVRANKN